MTIPFNRVSFVGKELQYVQEAYDNGKLSGDGVFTKKSAELLEAALGVPRVLLTTSCTHALELSAMLLNIEPGDEVILPSYTFPSVANAFVLRGATPVFADIRTDTLNLDQESLPRLINAKTKAIVAVHYAGVGCDMPSILRVANHRGVAVVEDNAHGLFGQYQRKYLGTWGQLATLSFHETKNISCGEGGALLINDPQLIERALVIREKGTNRDRYFRGEVDKYSWVDIGSSYLPSEILAAVLYAQLEQREKIQSKRKLIWDVYFAALKPWAIKHGIGMPFVPTECDQAYHMFYLLMPSLAVRKALIEHLKREGILSIFHYTPLHLSAMGKKWGGKRGDCPVTEDVGDRLLRLPFYYGLSESDQAKIMDSVIQFKI